MYVVAIYGHPPAHRCEVTSREAPRDYPKQTRYGQTPPRNDAGMLGPVRPVCTPSVCVSLCVCVCEERVYGHETMPRNYERREISKTPPYACHAGQCATVAKGDACSRSPKRSASGTLQPRAKAPQRRSGRELLLQVFGH